MKQLKLFPLSVMVFIHPACADFVGMYVDADSSYLPNQTTFRIFAVFDNPEDRVFGISGDTGENAPSLSFSSTAGLIQSCNTGLEVFCDSDFSGSDASICTPGSLLNTQGINAPNDTFLCVVGFNDSEDVPLVGDDLTPYVNLGLDFSPGVFCNATTPLPIEGVSWSTSQTEGGGTITFPIKGDPDPLPGETGPLVWIAQFTLPSDESFTFTGQVSYSRNIFPGVPGILVDEPFIVLSSDASIYKGSSCSNAKSLLAALQARLKDFEPGELLDACDDGVLDFCQGFNISDLRTFDCTGSGDADICDPDFQGKDGLPNLEVIDRNRDSIPDTCQCVADVNGDLVVDLEDVVEILFAFDTNSPDFNIVKGADSMDPTWDLVDEADLDAVLTVALPQSPSDFENIASEVLLFGCDIENSQPLAPASSEGDDAKGSHYGQTTTSPSVPVTDADVSPYQVILGELHRFRLPSSSAEADSTKARDDGAEPPVLTEADDKLNIPVAVDPVADLLSYFKPGEDLVGKPDSKSSPWDLDADGLLDPWSVLILPLASWPEELRPFAELFRP